jgi:uncharacterized membrane protein
MHHPAGPNWPNAISHYNCVLQQHNALPTWIMVSTFCNCFTSHQLKQYWTYPFISLIAFVIGMFASVRNVVCGTVVMSHDNRKAKYKKIVFTKHCQNWNTRHQASYSNIEARQQDIRPENGVQFQTNARECLPNYWGYTCFGIYWAISSLDNEDFF